MIPLTDNPINYEDIDSLIEWLKTYPQLTKGPLTWEFEKKWSEWQGCKYSVFVNSGSSANLLMLNTLRFSTELPPGSKIVVPALCWSTDISPVIQLCFEPVICDINLEDLSFDLNQLEEILEKEHPAAILLVSILGLSPNMERIQELASRYNCILLEDNCESVGTTFKGTKLGNFGAMSSFSFFWSHHACTIEGGMICTDSEALYLSLLAARSHGWDRDLPEEAQKDIRQIYKVDDFNALFTFYIPGYNLRATDIQAFLGLGQLRDNRLDERNQKRYDNFVRFYSGIKGWKPSPHPESWTSSFNFPILCDNRKELVEELRREGVGYRPLVCGSLSHQPLSYWIPKANFYPLTNAEVVDEKGLFLPNNPSLTLEQIDKMIEIVNRFQ